MPYICQDKRMYWDERMARVLEAAETEMRGAPAGELNYLITRLLLTWLGSLPRYSDYNAAIGVLECAKMELYRRQVAGYEDRKIAENGDI